MPWLEVVGWVGSALVVLSLTQVRVWRFRVLNLVGSVLATGYNAVLGIWPFVAMNGVIALINVYWLVRLQRERHDAAAYEVIEVDPTDTYLAHVLRVHTDDIRAFQPDFVWDPTLPQRWAFLVVRGDETVGVVLGHDAGAGVGQVELDYVSPRFRDFTPGEFVYRRSGVFAERGFRRLVAPPGIRDPQGYLPRVGFRPDGDGWVRDVSPLGAQSR
ncbi:YgjV family protein [Cellulomonas fimi]|uniref:YgjV family protein n=1 Tax=Cellulomonas fimi TaxID=1708 RepID=A0A7Y0LWH1_CELFI|nr:YgjV family protein [Cellulomonas fimi]NMR19114.1 YgjV family protein [Cellulomonas fimi]